MEDFRAHDPHVCNLSVAFGAGVAGGRPGTKTSRWTFSRTARHLELLGNKIWIEEEGRGEPLIMVPGGGGGSHDYYHPYHDALAKDFHVIYYDGYGRGKSEKAKSPDEYTIDRDVEEVEALRKALGLDKIHLLGHSFGGFVAQGYAVKYPQNVNKLVLANTMVSAADYQASTDFFNLTLEQYFPELWAELTVLRKKQLLANSPEIQQAYFGSIGKMMEMFYFYEPAQAAKIVWSENTFDPATYYGITGPDADFVVGGDIVKMDFTGKLKSLPFPILIIGGRADGVVLPRLVKNLAAQAPQAKLVMFEKSGHFAFMEENGHYVDVLKQFLSTQP
jgi:proline iminopeptidase